MPATIEPSITRSGMGLRGVSGSVAGIILGAGLTLLREYFDGSVHDERELREELELPILGSINHLPA